ncbi:MAG: hypothetical protein ABR592_12505 [Nitriliruptorales bacterium]
MQYEVRLVVKPRSPRDIGNVLGELGEIVEVAAADVTVDVRLLVEATTTEDASSRALRLVERAVTYADEVWQAQTPMARGDAGEAG